MVNKAPTAYNKRPSLNSLTRCHPNSTGSVKQPALSPTVTIYLRLTITENDLLCIHHNLTSSGISGKGMNHWSVKKMIKLTSGLMVKQHWPTWRIFLEEYLFPTIWILMPCITQSPLSPRWVANIIVCIETSFLSRQIQIDRSWSFWRHDLLSCEVLKSYSLVFS